MICSARYLRTSSTTEAERAADGISTKISASLTSPRALSDMLAHSRFAFIILSIVTAYLLQQVITLSFEEACKGVQKRVQLNVVDVCQRCKGTKSEPGFKATTCPRCNGSGMVCSTVCKYREFSSIFCRRRSSRDRSS